MYVVEGRSTKYATDRVMANLFRAVRCDIMVVYGSNVQEASPPADEMYLIPFWCVDGLAPYRGVL